MLTFGFGLIWCQINFSGSPYPDLCYHWHLEIHRIFSFLGVMFDIKALIGGLFTFSMEINIGVWDTEDFTLKSVTINCMVIDPPAGGTSGKTNLKIGVLTWPMNFLIGTPADCVHWNLRPFLPSSFWIYYCSCCIKYYSSIFFSYFRETGYLDMWWIICFCSINRLCLILVRLWTVGFRLWRLSRLWALVGCGAL